MNPQVLGNLTAVAQQIKQANQAAVKAQQMAANAQSSSDSGLASLSGELSETNSTIAGLSFGPTFVTPSIITSQPGVYGWTTLTVPSVPASATAALVEFVIDESNAASGQILVRATGTSSSYVVVGMTTANNVGGYSACTTIVPLINRQFDIEVTGGDSWSARLVGFFA